jgi:hypothetical protein
LNKYFQYEFIEKGPEAWNEWRKIYKEKEIDLRNCILTGGTYTQINLSYVNLTDVNFKNLYAPSANFSNAILHRAKITKSMVHGADFTNAKLGASDLSNSELLNANFENAELDHTNLTGANLSAANFKGARLTGSDLTNADLTNAKEFILDHNKIEGTIFPYKSSDRWSILRRKYTGVGMMWTLLFLLSALIPYGIKAVYWIVLNKQQEQDGILYSELTHNEFTVIQLVFAIDKGFPYFLIPITLVIYNLVRLLLTYVLAPLREEENRTFYTPVWKEKKHLILNTYYTSGYHLLYKLHLITSWLWVFSIIAFIYNISYWILMPVWMPK